MYKAMPTGDLAKQMQETIDLIERALEAADCYRFTLVGAHLDAALICARNEVNKL
jgi:hypothetical protein